MPAADVPPTSGGTRTVVHLITTLTQGGAERVLSEVVPRPGEHGEDGVAERHVVVSLAPGGMFADVLRDRGVEVRDLGMRPGRDLVRGVRELRRLVDRAGATHVIAWMYHACLVASLATARIGPRARGRTVRVVWFLQSSLADPASLSWHARAVIRILALASRTQSVIAANSSAGIADHAAAGYAPRSWRLVPNGCDTDRFRPDPSTGAAVRAELGIPDATVAVGYVGRNHPEKGYDRAVAAMALMASDDVHLVAIGAGTEGSSPRTTGLGVRSDIERLLTALDVLVLPSRTEGIPNALLEAMATGVPAIVTDVGDCRAIVGETGRVVPRDADPGVLRDAIAEVAELPRSERQRLGAVARARIVAEYDLVRARRVYRSLWDGATRGTT